MKSPYHYFADQGFTLLEVLVTTVIIAILAAIAAPSWLGFVNRQRLNIAQDQVYRAMLQAKSNAVKDKITWQVSIRETTIDGRVRVQWAVHPAESGTFIPSNVNWQNLEPNLQVYKDKNDKGKCETTLDQQGANTCPKIGPWRVQFNDKGNTNGQLGQLTLVTQNNPSNKRCVYVSTLIGTLRKGGDHVNPNSSNKYCY